MTSLNDFTQDMALAMLKSDEEFPVDFDDAWKWLGYHKKQDAKLLLEANLIEGFDFLRLNVKNTGKRGRPSENIRLTVDAFKSLGMMAGTAKGREIRQYFLHCERQLKQLLSKQSLTQLQPEIQPPPEIAKLLAQLQSLEHDIKVALKHRHAIHNIVEQPTLVDLSLNRIVHVAVHEQAEKLNQALAKLQSIRNVLLTLQSLTQRINQYQSLWATFNSLNQIVEELRQENNNLKQKLEQREAVLTSSVDPNYVPSLESLRSLRIKQLTAMLMATQKRTGGERALKSCTLKATILARYQFGESMDEIAADLQIPYSTVKTYVKLARRSLKYQD